MKTAFALILSLLALPAWAQTTTHNNSETLVDSRSIYVSPVVPFTPPSSTVAGNTIKETTSCGPLQSLVKTAIQGQFHGVFKSNSHEQGYTYELAPYLDDQGRMQFFKEVPIPGSPGSFRIVGHQAIIFTTVVGVSSMRNVALGGASSSGSWGQAGGGTSSATTQLVTNIQLRTCELGSIIRQPSASVSIEQPPQPQVVL
ncbi:hypothetical protein [Pseudoxanthomonas mexicana]